MKIRTKIGVFNLDDGEYLSVGYDTKNLFVYLIKGDMKNDAENKPICKMQDIKMAQDLSLSLFLAKENNIPVFDIEQWVNEYRMKN